MLPPSLQSLFSPLDPDSSSTGNTSNPRRGWSSLAKPALGMILAAGALTAGQAQAIVVTVNSQDWNVTTFTGKYNANTSKFALPSSGGVMPWWGNNSLASSFATAVGSSLGAVNRTGAWGPLFGYNTTSGPNRVLFGGFTIADNSSFSTGVTDTGTSYAWAQATPVSSPQAAAVPGPLPALGAAAAFGYSRKLRKRIKGSTKIGSGTDCL